MDLSPRRLAAWLGRSGQALGLTSAFVLWSAFRGDAAPSPILTTLRCSAVLAYGAATWIATRPLKRSIPATILPGLGVASLAATTVVGVQFVDRTEVLWKIFNACSLLEWAATALTAFAMPVLWGSAMACHDFGPDQRRLAANRIGGKLALSGLALQILATGVRAGAFYAWDLSELRSWVSVVLPIFDAVSVACAGWAAWLSFSLATAPDELRAKALRIHRLNLFSIAAQFPMILAWVGSRVDNLPYQMGQLCMWFLIPPLLRVIFALHLRAFWASPEPEAVSFPDRSDG